MAGSKKEGANSTKSPMGSKASRYTKEACPTNLKSKEIPSGKGI